MRGLYQLRPLWCPGLQRTTIHDNDSLVLRWVLFGDGHAGDEIEVLKKVINRVWIYSVISAHRETKFRNLRELLLYDRVHFPTATGDIGSQIHDNE